MNYVVFDIETGPRSDAADYADRLKADSRLKDAQKIEADLAKKKAEFVERGALSAVTGEVLAIGLLGNDGKPRILEREPEHVILEYFWKEWNQFRNPHAKFIGYNCRSFDMPFLIRRSWAWGVDVPANAYTEYRGRIDISTRVIDLMTIWKLGDYQERVSLDHACRALGIGSKTDDGKHYSQLMASDPEAARAYLRKDLELTHGLAVRLGVIRSQVEQGEQEPQPMGGV